jgi:hypothetical protein
LNVLHICAVGLFVSLHPATAQEAGKNPADVFGVAHVDGKYYLTTNDFLDEGADQVLATGSKVIKLYLKPKPYPWNSQWPQHVRSLAEMAQTPYFQSIFLKPFHTYILTAYSIGRQDHYWTDGITAEQAADETRQFYDLTKYLLTAYQGTGKTFVLQHWEGDWAMRRGSPKPYDGDYSPSPTAVQGMIHWLNARQAGIVKARTEAGPGDVHVYGATEANRLEDSMAGKPGVANSVLPYTTVDLASYSCYLSLDTPERLAKAVDYLAAHLPATAAFGQNAHSIYLGEYGYPENSLDGVSTLNRRMDDAITVTRQKDLPWAIFWDVYCNEPVNRDLPLPLNGKENDANLRGYWMVKPDGSPAMAWHRYRRMFVTADPDRATADGVKSKLSCVFTDDFSRSDSTNLGTAWTEAAHYGVVNRQIADQHLHFEIPDGHDIPWGSATLDLANPAVLGHGLRVGDYFEVTARRLSAEGDLGVELFDSDQLRVGGDLTPGVSPLKAWNGITWVPVSFDDHGQPVAFDWNSSHTLGVRLDSADGHHTTFSYYLDGRYAGSWLIGTSNTTLEKIGVYAQSKTGGAAMQFDDLKVYCHQR